MRSIQEHMQVVLQAVQALAEFVDAAQDGDWTRATQVQERVSSLESEADRLKEQIRADMPKRLWMPVARSDLLDLISAQDKIANRSQDISGLMLGRRMAFPPQLNESLADYLAVSVEATAAARSAVDATQRLFQSGFSEREAQEVERLITVVESLERRSDEQQVSLRAQLFELEADLPPVQAMFLYQVLDWLGSVSDRAEKVTHRLLLITKS